jgi:hypothetical protein
MKFVIFISICLFTIISEPAYAYCSTPSVPYSFNKPTLPRKPTTPYCINSYSGTSTCSKWEIDNYNNEVDTYNRKLKDYENERQKYILQLKEYLADAQEYAICEIKSLDE